MIPTFSSHFSSTPFRWRAFQATLSKTLEENAASRLFPFTELLFTSYIHTFYSHLHFTLVIPTFSLHLLSTPFRWRAFQATLSKTLEEDAVSRHFPFTELLITSSIHTFYSHLHCTLVNPTFSSHRLFTPFRWRAFQATLSKTLEEAAVLRHFPFTEFFADTPALLLPPGAARATHETSVAGAWRHIVAIFEELEECRAFELLRSSYDRGNFLLTKHAKVEKYL